ncbi:CopG family transcriptional regulator [Lichenihabitans psoromatis]|uniref:CopG family transcriptional regulator n=1 Tax=Lichenihabitans psoromatis TaxID=2528642 RepID=UPI0010360981|nr:CopG family transcriptional regulator [Lichenihabitans psoromatis]
MRTTLAIDDDVLVAAKAMARQQNRSLGEIISGLARKSLGWPEPRSERNGIPLLRVKPDAPLVTLEIVNALRDEVP